MRKPLSIACVILFMMISAALAAQGEGSEPVFEWKPVGGASAYLVQIRDAKGKIVAETETSQTSASFPLSPGRYEIKITTLNKFKKPASSSDWKPVTVMKTLPPRIDSFSPSFFYAGVEKGSLRLRGSDFLPDTEIVLEGEGRTLRAKAVPGQAAGEIEASFPLAEARPGSYSVRAANPKGMETEAVAKLLLKERIKPEISSFGMKSAYNDRMSPNVRVLGSGFEAEIRGSLSSERSEIPLSTILVASPTELLVAFNPGGHEPGSYRLILSNPGGLVSEPGPELSLRAPPVPALSSVAPNTAVAEGGDLAVRIEGRGFEADLSVLLSSKDLSVAPEVRESSDTFLSLIVPIGKIPPGIYELRLRNPSGGETSLREAFRLDPKREPSPPLALSVSPSRLEQGKERAELLIKGRDFKEGMTASFRSNGYMFYIETSSIEAESAKLIADPGNTPPGIYTLELRNPDGKTSSLRAALTIDPKREKPSRLSFTGAYRNSILLPGPGSAFGYSFLGLVLSARADLGNQVLGRLPVLELLGLETDLSFDLLPSSGGYLSVLGLSLALYGKSDFAFPLQAVVKAGLGAELNMGGGGTALGLGCFLSAGAEYSISESMFISGGAEISGGFSSLGARTAVRPFLGFGISMK